MRLRFLKKAAALVTSCALAAGLVQMNGAMLTAFAQETTETAEADSTLETAVFVSDAETADNDELFAEYVESVLYGGQSLKVSLFGNYAAMYFDTDSASYDLYTQLKAAVTEIAASGGSTEISFSPYIDFTYTGYASQSEAYEAFVEDVGAVLSCLIADCPSELYWYDKTSGSKWLYASSQNGKNYTFSIAILRMTVATAYQSDGSYAVDSSIATAAASTVAAAKDVVEQYSDLSDYEKLEAYKDWICDAVSYADDAYDYYTTYGYGDPWQIIYVFDGDADTNVVCEGYAKAFQYLCDLSDFEDDIVCYTVTGTLSGNSSAAGDHMWNIVKMEDGKYYLADITDCDDGMAGQYGGLFLAGCADGSVEDGYTFALSGTVTIDGVTYSYSMTAAFVYDSDCLALYSEEILTLAESDYEPADTAEDGTEDTDEDTDTDTGTGDGDEDTDTGTDTGDGDEDTDTGTDTGDGDEDADTDTDTGDGDEDTDTDADTGNSDEDADTDADTGDGDEDADTDTDTGDGNEDTDMDTGAGDGDEDTDTDTDTGNSDEDTDTDNTDTGDGNEDTDTDTNTDTGDRDEDTDSDGTTNGESETDPDDSEISSGDGGDSGESSDTENDSDTGSTDDTENDSDGGSTDDTENDSDGSSTENNQKAVETKEPETSGTTSGASVTLKKAVIKKAKSQKKKTITVKWKKISGAKKYQVSYRIKGKKKWKTVSVKKTSKTIKKLKSNKKYQIRVRAVGKSGTKTVYGKWSKVKTVKVK